MKHELIDKAVAAYRAARHPADKPGETMDHIVGLQAVLGLVEGMVLVPREFLEFVKSAPVSSGVCCCGGDMDHSPYEGHVPVDQWHHSLSLWLDQIVEPRPREEPSAS